MVFLYSLFNRPVSTVSHISSTPSQEYSTNIKNCRLAQHRIGSEVLFPGSGYLALAVEAITQLNSEVAKPLIITSYTLRDVEISNPTVVPDTDSGTEIIFHLQPSTGRHKISDNGLAKQWFTFTTSCYTYGSWKEVCRGHIGLNIRGQGSDHTPRNLPVTPLRSSHADWLERGRAIGIDLGPEFQYLGDVYSDGKSYVARGDMRVDNKCRMMEAESRYVFHPGVLDACMQIFNVSTFKGCIEEQRYAMVPTHFGEVTLFPPSADDLGNLCKLQSWTTERTTRTSLCCSQLLGYDGALLVDISNCRTVDHYGSLPVQMQGSLQRDLYVKHEWKLDVDYLQWASSAGILGDQPVATLVDAMLHKNIGSRTLCLEDSFVPSILSVRPTATITVSTPSETTLESIEVQQALGITIKDAPVEDILEDTSSSKEAFDIVIAPDMDNIDVQFLGKIRQLFSANGRLLIPMNRFALATWTYALEDSGFSDIVLLSPNCPIISAAARNPDTEKIADPPSERDEDRNLLLFHSKDPSSLSLKVSNEFVSKNWKVRSRLLTAPLELLSGERVIILDDAEVPLLASLNEDQLQTLVYLTKSCSAITWVTCGGLLRGDKPEYGLTEGAARVIRNEFASLDIVTVDFDAESTPESHVSRLLVDILERQRTKGRNGETEYYVYGGVVYVSRIISSKELNRQFATDSGESQIEHQKDNPALFGDMVDGHLRFCHDHGQVTNLLLEDEVEVHTVGIGITHLDGSDYEDFLNHQISGTVSRVGATVEEMAPGVNVFGFALDRLATFQRTSANLLQVIPPNLSLTAAATLPSPFVSALYALEELARIEVGEHVLIMDNMGSVGLAALQICRIHRANVTVITSSPASHEVLCTMAGLSTDQIIDTRQSILSVGINRVSAGKPVDVILCSAATDYDTIVELNQALAPFGRIVTVGSSPNSFSQTASIRRTITSISSFHFSLVELLRKRPKTIER